MIICLNLLISSFNPVSSNNSLDAASSKSSNFSNHPPGNPNKSSFLFPNNIFPSFRSTKNIPIPTPTSNFFLLAWDIKLLF